MMAPKFLIVVSLLLIISNLSTTNQVKSRMQIGQRSQIGPVNAQVATTNSQSIREGFQRSQNLAQVIRGRSRRSKRSALYFSGGSTSDISLKDILIVVGILIGVFAGFFIFALIYSCVTGEKIRWRKNHS
ncbi:UNKNOWN [Stylonychia lemnae]|uniref:Uncharacterized protein n=1 Tax=Stylonychia lemnae TaxID=5949 RepID=A0A077ZQX5_STYLE|nr:UNKNOWN [Stylonychia lemnae]|eukprot:CDW72298.1 UNKNOWN [Stylonychia lemnae]